MSSFPVSGILLLPQQPHTDLFSLKTTQEGVAIVLMSSTNALMLTPERGPDGDIDKANLSQDWEGQVLLFINEKKIHK